jgi:hypothetical protein
MKDSKPVHVNPHHPEKALIIVQRELVATLETVESMRKAIDIMQDAMTEAMNTVRKQREWVKRHHRAMARLNNRYNKLRLRYFGDNVMCPICANSFIPSRGIVDIEV